MDACYGAPLLEIEIEHVVIRGSMAPSARRQSGCAVSQGKKKEDAAAHPAEAAAGVEHEGIIMPVDGDLHSGEPRLGIKRDRHFRLRRPRALGRAQRQSARLIIQRESTAEKKARRKHRLHLVGAEILREGEKIRAVAVVAHALRVGFDFGVADEQAQRLARRDPELGIEPLREDRRLHAHIEPGERASRAAVGRAEARGDEDAAGVELEAQGVRRGFLGRGRARLVGGGGARLVGGGRVRLGEGGEPTRQSSVTSDSSSRRYEGISTFPPQQAGLDRFVAALRFFCSQCGEGRRVVFGRDEIYALNSVCARASGAG